MFEEGYSYVTDVWKNSLGWLQVRYGSLEKGQDIYYETVTFEGFDSSNHFNLFNNI